MALPEMLIGAGTGIGLTALTVQALNALKIQIPAPLQMATPFLGAAALYGIGMATRNQLAKRLTVPALVGSAAVMLLNHFAGKANGAGAYRLRGSGASAARATLPDARGLRYIPGAGASAAEATLARA